jgi:transcriptional regulator with XRE-family HTH domain
MATADYDVTGTAFRPVVPPGQAPQSTRRLHRVKTVRLQQGVSLRSVARQTGTDVRSLRLQEQESTDLRLSELRKWQKALDVPLAELLVDSDDPLSRPVMERARLIRLMKTVVAIQEQSPNVAIKRMAETMVGQLIEIMPELREVSAWHTYGQRRSLNDYGRVVEHQLSHDLLDGASDDE